MAGAIRKSRVRRVPLSEIKDDLSRFLHEAEKQEIVITRHGKPAGVLIGFKSEDDWFDYRIENDPRFLGRVEKARKNLRAGRGVRLEDVKSRDGSERAPPSRTDRSRERDHPRVAVVGCFNNTGGVGAALHNPRGTQVGKAGAE